MEKIEHRNNEAMKYLQKVEDTIEIDIPRMIYCTSKYGLEHVVKILFSYIEIFAGAYDIYDDDASRVKFIKKYFGKVNPKYEKIGGLFYTVYRHGLIHDFHPKRFNYNNLNYEWCIYQENPETHLTVFKTSEPKERKIPISLIQLYKDLKEAIRYYFIDLENNEDLRYNAGLKISRIQYRYDYEIKPSNYKTTKRADFIKNRKKKLGKTIANKETRTGNNVINTIIETEIYTGNMVKRSYIPPEEFEYLISFEEI